jgi:hypothetical protein
MLGSIHDHCGTRMTITVRPRRRIGCGARAAGAATAASRRRSNQPLTIADTFTTLRNGRRPSAQRARQISARMPNGSRIRFGHHRDNWPTMSGRVPPSSPE